MDMINVYDITLISPTGHTQLLTEIPAINPDEAWQKFLDFSQGDVALQECATNR